MPIMADGPSTQATSSESSASGLSDSTSCAPFVPVPDGEEQPDELPEGVIECSICLQSCIHPVRLPCSHIFCFLCVKGVANHSKRCALCRSEIPPDFLLRPMLLNNDDILHTQAFDGKYQWFYEGVRGWWQYDVRASTEIEDRYQKGERIFEMLIAGFLYIVDMENMVQYRRNTPSRRRRIKRDLVDIPDKKGVAGLSCKRRHPRRTGGDGGEREEALAAAAAGSSGGGAGATNSNNSATQVSSVQQQMRDLTLTEGDGGDTDNGNPQGTRSSRAFVSRPTATDGVGRVAADARAESRAADTSPARQINTRSRSSRVNRQANEASVNGQPNQGTRVSRVNSPLVDSQSSLGSRMSRRDVDGRDAASNFQPSTSARINPRVSSAGPHTKANVQALSLNSRGNRVNSPVVDHMPANKQQKPGNRVHDRGISQQVDTMTTNNGQPTSSVDVNHSVASRASQPVVQNCVDIAARNDPATLDGVGKIDQASVSDLRGTSPAQRKIEGEAELDRADRVDGSSDSD